jgi:hypothetical protein
MQFSRKKEKGKIIVGAKHYRHHLRKSPQSSYGNASPKPHNAATIYRRKQRGLSICRSRFFVRSLNIVAQMLNPYSFWLFLAIYYDTQKSLRGAALPPRHHLRISTQLAIGNAIAQTPKS